jgi:hypothetical protein
MFSAILASAPSAGAMYVHMLEPYGATLYLGNSTFLGDVGPGQTFYITISAATTNVSGALNALGWNRLSVSDLPSGWISENSPLYTSNLSVEITPASDAKNGTYNFTLTASCNISSSNSCNLTFSAYINVTPNVFKLNAFPSKLVAGPGEPAVVEVSINNTGVSDSPFTITEYGLPAFDNITEPALALHHTSENFSYPIYEDTPGIWPVSIHVQSSQSPLVYKQTNVTLVVNSSVLNDYQALGQGAVAFPIIYEPAYAVMYLISLIFKS